MTIDQARIVSEIYDAAVEPALWPIALESVAEAFGAAGAGIFVHDARTRRPRWAVIAGPGAEMRDDYVRHFGPIDPFRKVLDTAPYGHWQWATECLSAERLRTDEWYNGYMLRCGLRDALAARLHEDAHTAITFGLDRGLEQRAFAGPAPDRQPILDALGKAGRLICRLDQARWTSALALQALDRVAAAVMIAEADGRLVDCNAAAERLLRLDDGLGLRSGLLSPRRAFEALKLARMVTLAAAPSDPQTGHMLIGRANGRSSYAVTVAPLGPALAPGEHPLALVLVADPDEYTPSHKDLAEFFGFSPAESRLAAALMQGRKLDRIAAELGVRISTLRSQLSAILRKAGVERQADLMRVLSTVRLIETKPARR